MVIGAIWLLRTGAIQLSEAAKGGKGINVDILNKIKIHTSYPAVGLFIIGLLFLLMAVWFSKPALSMPLNVVGEIKDVDPNAVTIKIEPANMAIDCTPDSNGSIDRLFHADFQSVHVVINAAGYDPPFLQYTLRIRAQQIALPSKLKFTKIASTSPSPGQIQPLPSAAQIPPLHEGSGFK